MEWCTIEKIPIQVDLNSELNITIIEVGSIKEAMVYFVEEQTI